jgi:N4-gp56 family major capsid protein
MALNTALTNTTTTSQAIKNRYYDELFLRLADKKLVHKQLGQLNRKVAQGQGGYGSQVLYWTKWVNFPVITASATGEGVPSSALTFSALNVTGTTAQYDNAVSISDIAAYASFGDVMKAAVERLAYNAGLSIDTVVRDTISVSGTQQSASAVAYWSAVPAGANLIISEIRKATRTLQAADAIEQDDGSWVAVVHPHALYDLMGDSTTGGWIDANKYSEGGTKGMLNGEVGKLYGVRFLQSTNAYTRGSSYDTTSAVVASTTIYVTSVFGKDAFGVSELQALKTYVKPFGSGGVGDPTDKIATAGWKTLFGSNVLNSAFFVNINHTVSSTA